jgi:hypothetical protein
LIGVQQPSAAHLGAPFRHTGRPPAEPVVQHLLSAAASLLLLRTVLPLQQSFDLLSTGPADQELFPPTYDFLVRQPQPGFDSEALPASLFHGDRGAGSAGRIRFAKAGGKTSAVVRLTVDRDGQLPGQPIASPDCGLQFHAAQFLLQFAQP